MTDFTPTPEAVEAVATILRDDAQAPPHLRARLPALSRAAIAAFVEAEGLTAEIRVMEGIGQQLLLVGPWRKRD